MGSSKAEIGKRIKQALNYAMISQKDIAEVVGCSESTISAYISGRNEPSTETLVKIAEACEVLIEWLITGKGKIEGKRLVAEFESPLDVTKTVVSEMPTGYSPEIEAIVRITKNNPLIKLIIPGMAELPEDEQYELYKIHREMLRKSKEKGGSKAAPDED